MIAVCRRHKNSLDTTYTRDRHQRAIRAEIGLEDDEAIGRRARLRHDVTALAALERRTGSPGEAASAAAIEQALRAAGCSHVARHTFATPVSWAPSHLAYVLTGIAAALLPGRAARLVALGLATSYELEASNRSQWVRRLLPRRNGTSVSARIPASGRAERTLVLAAHHDAAQTGWVWHRHAVAASHASAKRTGRALPSHLIPLLGLALTAVPSRPARRIAVGILGASAALMAQAWRSPATPGANDNASGVAAALEVARRLTARPLDNVEVQLVFPGGEEVGAAGMHDWLQGPGHDLDPRRTLVVNLDAVGSNGPLAVSSREGLTTSMRDEDTRLALEVARAHGVRLQPLGLPNPTDAVMTRHAGIPTVSVLSSEDGWISNLHQPTDTVANVCWETVEDAVRLAEALARTLDCGDANATPWHRRRARP